MATGAKCLFSARITRHYKSRHLYQISRFLQSINPLYPEEYHEKIDKDGFREFDLYQQERGYNEAKGFRRKRQQRPAGIKDTKRLYKVSSSTPYSIGYTGDVQCQTFNKLLDKVLPPRSAQMPTNQHWPNVWPTAKSFNWSQIPFNVRQGFTDRSTVPKKQGNLELMKIPNFLHLSPPHINQHCEVLKDLCTEWPEELETYKDCREYFPIEVVTTDYLFSGPSIRDERARKCTVKFDLDDLDLDYHARDKFLRLVGDRYNKKTNRVTFVTDSCPLKKQNYDYAMYLLTAVYFESWTTEPWEREKEESDWETYHWDLAASRKSVVPIVQQIRQIDQASSSSEGEATPEDEETIVQTSEVQEYKRCVTELHNQGENIDTLTDYKNAVLQLYKLSPSHGS